MNQDLSQFSTLTFDCYGTLIDWETGIWDALQPLIHANRRDDITRARGLATFAEFESAQQAETPDMRYPELLAWVHRRIAVHFGMDTDAALDRTFGASVPHWPAFPDSADALRSLKTHFRLVVLSNVDRDGFTASSAKLGVDFDAVYTAEDIGSYKPTPRNFDHMLTRLQADHGITREAILHTAQSLFHDHVPATRAGLAKAWIDRQNLAGGGGWGATAPVEERPKVDFHFSTLAAMAEAVSATWPRLSSDDSPLR